MFLNHILHLAQAIRNRLVSFSPPLTPPWKGGEPGTGYFPPFQGGIKGGKSRVCASLPRCVYTVEQGAGSRGKELETNHLYQAF